MAKRLYNILAAVLLASVFALCQPAFVASPLTAEADAVAEIAMELNCGTVLHEKNADRKLPMASTTKIMTAYVVVSECNLDEVIKVPDEAVGIEGSSIYLKKDEEISVRDLLYGLMLRSGNDAACALAVHHSGSIEKFVEKMNLTARELGAVNTNFKNPNGLPDDEHYTTARDLCAIACAAMKNPTFAEIVSTRSYCGDYRNFTNKNKLLNMLDGANGVKTGYTEKAGRCLVSSAKRGNMDVICVVLNCYDMYERSKSIIESGFNDYCVETISGDKIFAYNGKLYSLTEDCTLCVKKGAELKYRITSTEDGCVLEFLSENNLLFSHNLYTISLK